MRIESYAPGSFCWSELATTDAEAARGFYGDMFGWTAVDVRTPMGVYTLFQSSGNDVGGMYTAPPGVPSNWGPHFSVGSADDSASKAIALDGKVVAGPFDAHEAGRMAVIKDPQGAIFTLWQAKKNIGATHGGPLNNFCWPELHTPDAPGAVAFYSGLFGWGSKPESGFEKAEYVEWTNTGKSFGGMMPMRGPMWKGVPPHWMLYVSVANCDERADKVKALGGGVCVPPTDIPKVGRFSVINDPQGATLSIVQLLPMQVAAGQQ